MRSMSLVMMSTWLTGSRAEEQQLPEGVAPGGDGRQAVAVEHLLQRRGQISPAERRLRSS